LFAVVDCINTFEQWCSENALPFLAPSFVSLVWVLQLEVKQATNVFSKRTVNVDYSNVSINWRKKSDNSSNEGHCWRCSRFQTVINSVPS